MFYRQSNSSSLIGQAVALLSADIPELASQYEPDLVFIATWDEVTVDPEGIQERVSGQQLKK